MSIDKQDAIKVLQEALQTAQSSAINPDLMKEVTHFISLCERANARTHIAFYVTSLLAKIVDSNIDLFSIKPAHSGEDKNSYSARILCETVIVPFSVENHINIGVTGRQPLNNQPYFRMRYFGDDTPFSTPAIPIRNYLLTFLKNISANNSELAFSYLVTFFQIMKQNEIEYSSLCDTGEISIAEFIDTVSRFVNHNSEGGKRAQAVVAGLLDTHYGVDYVMSGRINDPSRHYPGDVFVTFENDSLYNLAFEVRDKPVSTTDVQIFIKKCVQYKKTIPGFIMVSPNQGPIDLLSMKEWALASFNIYSLFYIGWFETVYGLMANSCHFSNDFICRSISNIRNRLIQVEISKEGMDYLGKLLN